MRTTKSLHTLNARDNVMLAVMRDYFQIPPEKMFHVIQSLRHEVEEALAPKSIKYDNLKTALVPDRKRKEIALVFDTLVINDSWYGLAVFDRLIPLFTKNSNHAVLIGDYIDTGAGQERLFKAMRESLFLTRDVEFKHSSQFFIVYINNLTDAMVSRFHQGLRDWDSYIGYADMTYASIFKTFLSTMLGNCFIKHRRIILQGHEDDRPNTENVNVKGYPFEQNGYVCRSIQGQLEGTLLSYKIERPVYPGFETDTEFSLNAISPLPLPLDDFRVEVEKAKLEYIKIEKSGSVAKAGLEQISSEELANLLKSKISASYIYNLSVNEAHDATKFNVIIEMLHQDTGDPVRLLASMEYQPERKTLRLITLY